MLSIFVRFRFWNFNKNKQPIPPKVPCQTVGPSHHKPTARAHRCWHLLKPEPLVMQSEAPLHPLWTCWPPSNFGSQENIVSDSFSGKLHLYLGTNCIMVLENTMHCYDFLTNTSVKMADRRRNWSPTSTWLHMYASHLSKPSRASSIPGILFTPVTGVRCFRKIFIWYHHPFGPNRFNCAWSCLSSTTGWSEAYPIVSSAQTKKR